MLLEVQKGNAEIIEKAVALLRGKVPEGKIALAETFTRQYYSRVEAEDLAERNLSDLCGAALAHLDFMGKFKSVAAKLRDTSRKGILRTLRSTEDPFRSTEGSKSASSNSFVGVPGVIAG